MRSERRTNIRRIVALGLALAVMVAAGAPVLAQSAPKKDEFVMDGGGDITLDVKDRPLKDVVDYIRDKTNVNIIVAEEAADERVTIHIKQLHWLRALELVAEKAECILEKVEKNLIKVSKPPQVSFDFQDADVRKVISVIAAYSGANIVVGQEVQGTVTVRLNRVPWRSALDTVVKTLGFVVVEDDRGILRVTDPARLQEQLETRVYTFQYVRPPDPYMATIKTNVHTDSVKAPSSEAETEFNLLKAFRAAVAPEGTLEYVKASNSVVVTGTAPKLAKLEELIAQVDIEPIMVGVDLQFITTRNADFLDVGFDPGEGGWSISGELGDMVHRLPFNLGDGGWEDSISAEGEPGGPKGDFQGTGPNPIAAGSGFTFGTLAFSGVASTLNLAKRDANTRVVQAPRILTLDNQVATLFVGETIRYARTTAESSQQGGLQFSIDEADNSPVQTGFQVLVSPHVIPGTEKVMMTVIPQQTTLTGTSAELPGFNIFQGGTGANEVQIALPQEASSTVVTHMLLESGETAVLGGLLTDSESKSTNKLPMLGELPVIGWLFKGQQSSKTKENLIILITPHLLKGAEDRRSALNEEMSLHVEKIRKEWENIAGEEMNQMNPDKNGE